MDNYNYHFESVYYLDYWRALFLENILTTTQCKLFNFCLIDSRASPYRNKEKFTNKMYQQQIIETYYKFYLLFQ